MTYKDLDDLLGTAFLDFCNTKKVSMSALQKQTKIDIRTLYQLYDVFKVFTGDSYYRWVRLILPNATDKWEKHYSKSIGKKFIVLYDGTVVFDDWTIYKTEEVQELKGQDDKQISKIHDAKSIFKGSKLIAQ